MRASNVNITLIFEGKIHSKNADISTDDYIYNMNYNTTYYK